ncbi:DUF456 domain-containing protein [Arsenicicoccus piscis]|uniref:Membrane protein n=1 Tax=Arsenicicoccus piscis TaxID=673954 RepID=A0ABQ6HN05_9MICO|nr:DUF456 domain-containing protein [Arsenicicoccus piscis]MCH8628615.1 DUF456 domain-containing protein [Arsenicicoccus piscis]GMA19458.1 membrane protein [Arsenicicoccus piscis]
MDSSVITSIAALGVVVGLLGIVIPVLPGLLLVWGSVAVWAALAQSAAGWAVLAIVTVLYGIGLTTQYLLPGRALKNQGIHWTTTLAGVAVGIVGFFVIPVVGFFAGFVLGIFLVQLSKLGSARAAWPSTVHALRAVGLSMLIELGAGVLIAATFAVAVLSGVGR